MTEARTAVMLMSYGTPRTQADILPYYTDIRRGNPPTDQQLADLTARYDAIGGISPLAERSEAQRRRGAGCARRPRPWPVPRDGGNEARAAIHRSVRRRAGVTRFPTCRRAGARAALLGVLRRPVPRSVDRCCRSSRHVRRGHSQLGDDAGLHRLHCQRGTRQTRGDAGLHACRVHLALTAPANPCQRRPVPVGDRGNGEVCRRRGRPRELGARLAERRPHAGAMAGTRHPARSSTTWDPTITPTDCWSAQSDSSPTTWRSCTTSTSRPLGGPLRHDLAFARTACVNDDPAVMAALADARRARNVSGDRHIAVVGGGIGGLAAAHAAIEAGARVTLFESSDRLGGMILTTPFAGRPAIDEGADAFLARVPWAVELARKVSLAIR